MDLHDLRVVITGASRGFGASLAESFARRGAMVFAGMRTERRDARSRERVIPIALDVTSDGSVADAAFEVSAHAPAIDVLVNNAAIRMPKVMNPIEQIDADEAARTFDVNAIGPLRVVRAFLPMLRDGSSPSLVNVSSEAGSIEQCRRDREFDYCMSKAALNMATALLANYLRGKVRVFSLHPGWLRTDMGGAHAALDPDETAESVVELIARQRALPEGSEAPLFLDHLGNPMPW
jgi:NAD(P)-dependent dehydrogenase (short-subunit alcohol dehydrogenase family)